MADDNKTEQPTPKKLKDARKKGQVVRSKDLAVAAATVAGVVALGIMGQRILQGSANRLATDLAHFGDTPLRPLTAGDLNGMIFSGLTLIIVLVGPLALATMAVGVGVMGFQGGWNVAPEAMHFNWSRMSPAKGIKQLGLSRGGVDTLKTFVIVAMIVWLAWGPVRELMTDGPRMAWMTPEASAALGWTYTERVLWRVAAILALLAIADYGIQRHRIMKSLKMSKQEIRDEGRLQEGSPEIKAKVRKIQRDMARSRMMGKVQDATVVVTNPTHFAVALEYRRGEMAAPIVLAKGQDHIALQIRERARQHGVPIVEDKPLARALYASAEIGDAIPSQLFAAVAEVLAQLIRLKRLVL
jgi:flagellar biosynthetic protein FlhB